ncbi:MAG: DinB family protein [Phycisphaerales bacterium]|nr:DinB family protein [Phycisphaerales bacterium]
MHPATLYSYLTRSRARVFDWVRPLSPEDYARGFPIGPGSLAAVLTHIYISEWYYIRRMLGREVPASADWPIRDDDPPPFARLEAAWAVQASETADAIGAVPDWDAQISYTVTDDAGKRKRVTTTPTDIFSQLVLHEVHHRAQALNILRRLGVKTEDIDYNLMTYTITDA